MPHQLSALHLRLGQRQHLLDDLAQGADHVDLGRVVRGAGGKRLDGGALAAVGGHQDHRHHRIQAADLAHQLETVQVGHAQIGEDRVGQVASADLEGLSTVLRLQGLEVLDAGNAARGQLPVHRVVVNDQKLGHRHEVLRVAAKTVACRRSPPTRPTWASSIQSWEWRCSP